MNNKYLNLVLLSALAFSPLAAVKAASLIGVNYGPSIETGLDTNANINTDLNGQADLDASVGSEADADSQNSRDDERDNTPAGTGINLRSDLNTSIEGEVMTVRRADLEEQANVNAIASFRNSLNRSANESQADARSEGGISAQAGIPNTGASALQNANDNAFANANENSILLRTDSVATQEDLRLFALAAIEADENLNAMSFANDEVVVSYKADGRFIGILPVVMDVDVRVNQEGEVEFGYPWYSFLIVKDTGDLEADIRSEVDAAISSEADGGWTNFDRAELAASIAGALRTYYESNTATTTDQEV